MAALIGAAIEESACDRNEQIDQTLEWYHWLELNRL